VSVRRDWHGHVPEAYEAATELAERGCDFVLAPLRGADRRVVHQVRAHPVVVSPYVAGEWLFERTADQDGSAQLASQLHECSVETILPAEDYRCPFVPQLEQTLSRACGADTDAGPYSEHTQRLVRAHRYALDSLIREADRVSAACRADTAPFVLTHSESIGNTMRTPDNRLLLFDWGEAALGPPERDWWDFDRVPPGVVVRPAFTRFYELRWTLGELADYVHRFIEPHTGDADDQWMWRELQQYLPPA
jgi:spectinomycin phosphotransferase